MYFLNNFQYFGTPDESKFFEIWFRTFHRKYRGILSNWLLTILIRAYMFVDYIYIAFSSGPNEICVLIYLEQHQRLFDHLALTRFIEAFLNHNYDIQSTMSVSSFWYWPPHKQVFVFRQAYLKLQNIPKGWVSHTAVTETGTELHTFVTETE